MEGEGVVLWLKAMEIDTTVTRLTCKNFYYIRYMLE